MAMTENDAQRDLDARKTALAHATHDGKGNLTHEQVVDRAKAYYAFLMPDDPMAASQDVPMNVLVDRFLQWRLPENFNPDNGISFKPPSVGWPVGTNLLDATQAKAMLHHVLGYR